jgi:prepilin-type N-terminal cleavage/methylation domain-containing protein
MRAFTLIELLTVVAIIAILAAIAVPNFLEAQVRSKVARTQADMRTVATALESYAVDAGRYPPHGEILATGIDNYPARAAGLLTTEYIHPPTLTSPVAYLATLPVDPFTSAVSDIRRQSFGYLNSALMVEILTGRGLIASARGVVTSYGQWRLYASGPDRDRGPDTKVNILYDPTNGTVSNGDIVRTQRVPELKLAADEGT